MLTAMLAALASTIDSHLNWGASYWSNDLYKAVWVEGIRGRQANPRELVRVARIERDTAIEECLDELPEHYRAVIVLRDFDGLEWNEVAEQLGKNTDSAARELHKRALQDMTKLLQRRGIGPDLT